VAALVEAGKAGEDLLHPFLERLWGEAVACGHEVLHRGQVAEEGAALQDGGEA